MRPLRRPRTTKRPALKRALARAGRPLRMPSPHASVSESRSTARGRAAGCCSVGSSATVPLRCDFGRGAPPARRLLRGPAPWRPGRSPPACSAALPRATGGGPPRLADDRTPVAARRSTGRAGSSPEPRLLPELARTDRGKAAAPVSERSRALTRSDERLDTGVEIRPHGADERNLQHDLCVRRVAHVDQARGRGSPCSAPRGPGPWSRPASTNALAATGPRRHTVRARARRGRPGGGRRSARWPVAAAPTRRP